MSRLDDLPPDLRAVLSLLLRQRKGYAEVAGLLHIQKRAVHDRAHAALALLAPRQARELSAEQRLRIGDYLLSQQGVAERRATEGELTTSAPARAWAQALAAELAPLASTPLPQIAGAAPRTGTTGRALPSSRLGGALLLGAIAIVVIVAVVLSAGGSGGGSGGSHAKTTASTQTSTSSSGSTTSTAGSTSSSAATPKEEGHSSLTSPDPSSKAKGTVLVLSESGKRAFYLQITGLAAAPSGSSYAVWLTGTGIKAQAVGLLPAPNSAGRIEGGALLPSNASSYHRVIVTRETSQHPASPGTTVLGGPLTLSAH
jgi:hypothetical protein